MKNLTTALMIFLTLFAVSCGDKKKSNSSSSFSTDPLHASSQDGYFNPYSAKPFEAGGVTYAIPQSNTSLINYALQQAQYSNVQPVVAGGVQKYRAHITGYLVPMTGQYGNMGTPVNQVQEYYLNITAISFY